MLKLSYQKKWLEAGVDEAGRGCLAGPVFAAAVVLPKKFKNAMINDSKQLNEKKRYELRNIIEQEALSFGVAQINELEIDKINILKASIKAMHAALGCLTITPELILVDGNRFYPYRKIKHQCIIKGDGLYLNIAAASILAKTYRDDFMMQAHQQYPQYYWNKNKGYGTAAHVEAILEFGYSPLHRKTFIVKSLQQLPLF
ncbi:MAG: ribonuclease HII [Bacteroidetes bacterium]|nr:ribonuclease HII [Bacteroidota bacterium]